jgi:hypothetical protein
VQGRGTGSASFLEKKIDYQTKEKESIKLIEKMSIELLSNMIEVDLVEI